MRESSEDKVAVYEARHAAAHALVARRLLMLPPDRSSLPGLGAYRP